MGIMGSNSFSDFYQKYLGLYNGRLYDGVRVCKCKYRDVPLNKKFFYKVIATVYNGEKVISCSPEFDEAGMMLLCSNIHFEAIGTGDIHRELRIPGYGLSYMERMLLNSQPDINTDVIAARSRNKQIEYHYLEAYKKHIALLDGELIGYCKVSDVIAGYGNLVVWVEESRRRSGIAESLVKLMSKKCFEEGIVPMYIVKTDNQASAALAGKLGFQVIQRELVYFAEENCMEDKTIN